MPKGPFNGPRPFTTASMVVSFTFNKDPGFSDLEAEQRLRRNGISRADVQLEESQNDSRVQVRVITNEEEMTHQTMMRLIGQVKDMSKSRIPDTQIDVFCT